MAKIQKYSLYFPSRARKSNRDWLTADCNHSQTQSNRLRAVFLCLAGGEGKSKLVARSAAGVDKFAGSEFGRTQCARRAETRDGFGQSLTPPRAARSMPGPLKAAFGRFFMAERESKSSPVERSEGARRAETMTRTIPHLPAAQKNAS
jgi:hypothetical protein